MKTLLKSKQIEEIIDNLAERIIKDNSEGQDMVRQSSPSIAIIGIRSRGEILAQRLSARLSEKLGREVPCGVLDITLYRDDLNSPKGNSQPVVRTTEIGFDIDGKVIILVDDVLYTGRSARAAMDALIDLGRPKVIRLAVLVERAGREFPIQADYTGYKAKVNADELVSVLLTESDGKDEVLIE